MKIYTKLQYYWDDRLNSYVLDKSESFEYNGVIELMCGASGQQKDIGASQQTFMNQLQSQAGQVFGASSTVFQNLLNTFTPTVQAGPNQQGFSPAELAVRNSQAITNAGTAYKNAKAALGENNAATGGGNTGLPSGAAATEATELANAGANNTANQLNQIQEENYATGRQNYDTAVSGLAQAPNVFGAATSAAGAANNAGEAAANTANQISQQNNSWMSAVGGILGGVAGAATGGLVKGFGGGGSSMFNGMSGSQIQGATGYAGDGSGISTTSPDLGNNTIGE